MHDTKLTDCRQTFEVLPISSVRERAPYYMITLERRTETTQHQAYRCASLRPASVYACALV
eukprot:3258841-Pleurochrysis_carterae.AAC.1